MYQFHCVITSNKTDWRFETWETEHGVIEAEQAICDKPGFASASSAREQGYSLLCELPPVQS